MKTRTLDSECTQDVLVDGTHEVALEHTRTLKQITTVKSRSKLCIFMERGYFQVSRTDKNKPFG